MNGDSERSRSTRKGIIAEELVRRALKAKKGPPCDIVTPLGAFELHWGRTSKNWGNLKLDLARAKEHGGYCVQIAGAIPQGHRRMGVKSLYELLKEHDVSEPAARAAAIRRAAEEIA